MGYPRGTFIHILQPGNNRSKDVPIKTISISESLHVSSLGYVDYDLLHARFGPLLFLTASELVGELWYLSREFEYTKIHSLHCSFLFLWKLSLCP